MQRIPAQRPGVERKGLRDYPSYSLNAGRIAFPGQRIDGGYHGAAEYMRGEAVDLIFASDFSSFDKSSGIYRCQVPTSFRGQRIDTIQLSACSLDINNPNSNPSEASGAAPGSSDEKDNGGAAGLAEGSGILPVPPRLYMERLVSYASRGDYYRPIFDGGITLHNKSTRKAITVMFPKEYTFFKVSSFVNGTLVARSVVAPAAQSGSASTGDATNGTAQGPVAGMTIAQHNLTDYDIKNRLVHVLHGLPAGQGVASWPPKRDTTAAGSTYPFANDTLIFQLTDPAGTVKTGSIVALQVKPFDGYTQVNERINSALEGFNDSFISQGVPLQENTGLHAGYTSRGGSFSVGPPDVVYVPDGQPLSGRAMCGLTVCQALGIEAGTDGQSNKSPPQIVRRDVVTLAEGHSPIAYALQSGQHLANSIRNAYSRLDPRMAVSSASPSVAVITAASANARLEAKIGSEPFRSVDQMCEKVANELNGQQPQGSTNEWTVAARQIANGMSVLTLSTTEDVVFQVLGSDITVTPGAPTTVSTDSGLRMLGLMNGIIPCNGGLGVGSGSFGSTSTRGVPILSAPDPRFGSVHLFQPDRELRESTLGVVTGRPPIPVVGTIDRAPVHQDGTAGELIRVKFAMTHGATGANPAASTIGHPFHAGDLVEALDANGSVLSSTRFLVLDESNTCTLLPLRQTGLALADIKSVRRVVFDNDKLYANTTMTQTTNIFVHEYDMGKPGPDSADVPQPIVAFGTHRLGSVAQLGVNVAIDRSPNMHRHSCSPDVDVVYVRLVHNNIFTNKVPSLPSEVGRASGILGRITHHNSKLAMDRSQSGSAKFPNGTRLPSELQFQFLDRAGNIIKSGLKQWSLTCTIPPHTLNLDRA